MTKAADAILAVITVTTLYLALYCKAIPTPTIFHDEILPMLPWWALIITCFITRKLKADSPIEYLKLVEDILHYLVESNVNFKQILACHDTDIHTFIKKILDELTGEVYIRRVNENYYEYVP